MKAVVDTDLCIGCEECEAICPEVFQMQDGVATVKADPVPPANEETCREAIEACPVDALCSDE